MRKYLQYGLFFFLPALCFLSCSDKNKMQLPDMTHSYAKRSKKPFGTYAAYTMLEEKYKTQGITTLTNTFHDNWIKQLSGNKGLYILLSKNMMLSQKDIEAMLDYVNNGNQLFIAAEYFDGSLLDTLGVQVHYQSLLSIFQNQLSLTAPMRNTTVTLTDSSTFGKNRYGYFYYPFRTNFVKSDSTGVSTLGLNDSNDPNFISLVYGKGRFFFHLHPETFSNYFVLTNNNQAYIEKIFSYMATNRTVVYWDDYYRLGIAPTGNFSSLAVFLKYPMLKWALFLAMTLMLFYISFGSKRKQRAIPLIPQNSNDTVSFTETIGRLYLQKKDNHNIAHKMITYLMEHIRTHYYLNTSQLNAEFFSSLSKKSNVHEEEVKNFFKNISHLQEVSVITDEQLLELNNQIQLYFKL